jgi:hypothetical protein
MIWKKFDMPNEKLQDILTHLLMSHVKLNDAPASSQAHFDYAIVELDKLIENYRPSNAECRQVLTDAIEHMGLYDSRKPYEL